MASDPEVQWLLRIKAVHPSLQQLGHRRRLPSNDDSRYYAFLLSSSDGRERVLVVTNFWATPQRIRVDTSGLRFKAVTDLRTGATSSAGAGAEFILPAFGYRLFQLQ